MTTQLTAQNVFNGPGWDDKMMLEKAERELSRLRACRHILEAQDHMWNCAVTIAAVCDWKFHIHLSSLPRWKGRTEQNFTHWVRNNCPDAFVFIDIANEYKHANRNTPSTIAQKMMMCFYDLGMHPELRTQVDLNHGWIQPMKSTEWYLYPSIKFNDTTENFHFPAQRAIAWWKNFMPADAVPMNAKNTVIAQEP